MSLTPDDIEKFWDEYLESLEEYEDEPSGLTELEEAYLDWDLDISEIAVNP